MVQQFSEVRGGRGGQLDIDDRWVSLGFYRLPVHDTRSGQRGPVIQHHDSEHLPELADCMKIGWVRDATLKERLGGAQVCEDLLRRAAPDSVELIDCPPGALQTDVDAYVALRCQLYSSEEIGQMASRPLIHYEMDYWEFESANRAALYAGANYILWCSPLHAEVMERRYGIRKRGESLPCPMDVNHWLDNRSHSNGDRAGAMWYGEAHPLKGPDIVMDWAEKNQVYLDLYGINLPPSNGGNPYVRIVGQVDDVQRDLALASHEQFVHFPRQPEPFCYSLLEAWLAGLTVTYAGRIGIDSYGLPWPELAERCHKAPQEFWRIVEREI